MRRSVVSRGCGGSNQLASLRAQEPLAIADQALGHVDSTAHPSGNGFTFFSFAGNDFR
jgi:hypothetical protein